MSYRQPLVLEVLYNLTDQKHHSYVVCVCSQDFGKVLGYANYAEMSLSTKMAGSVQNVLSMIGR